MVAFNFKKEFVPLILSGEKFSTIRKSRRCGIGTTMHLFTGQRTKHCQRIADVICTGWAEICLSRDNVWFIINENPYGIFKDVNFIHEMEGFANAKDMYDFFKEQYGLPFNGFLHQWEPLNKEPVFDAVKITGEAGEISEDFI